MNTKTTISITEARKKIFDLAEAVQAPGMYYTFTEKGRPKAVMLSAEEFEGWVETLEVVRDFPDLKKRIAQVKADMKSGAYKQYTALRTYLDKHPVKQKDAPSTHPHPRRRKRA